MCLIAFAIGASPRWPLVIAANRDEYLDRPTLPLARWTGDGGQTIISGRDLLAGGTWLGATPAGRIAFLTNLRQGDVKMEPAKRSRGELVTRWLQADIDAAGFAAMLRAEAGDYGGFNLVLGDFRRNAWTWITNQVCADPTAWRVESLDSGVYGLSNAALDTPWPKTVALKKALETALLARTLPDLQSPLWRALANRERFIAASVAATGTAGARDEALSSAFVDFPENAFGTRCSSVLAVEAKGADSVGPRYGLSVEERSYGQRHVTGEIDICEASTAAFLIT